MRRKAELLFEVWRQKPDDRRKPLIIQGARQVGKTYFATKICSQYYADIIYLNLEIDRRMAEEFENNIEPKALISKLEMYFQRKIHPGTTLIFFDEIQSCERALTALKYFCEFAPEYHIVAAGSLLGVAVNRAKYSFPVGKVDFLNLYPLDFEEFLWALGHERLAAEIAEHYHSLEALSASIHSLALELFEKYLIIGGMPAAIGAYNRDASMIDSRVEQASILESYVADMSKYATATETTKIIAAYNSIPAQLAKDNRKFQYKIIQRGGSATLFGASLDWLTAAGIILQCGRISHGSVPLAVQRDFTAFKIYMNDVGLLVNKSGTPVFNIVNRLSDNTFVGAIIENYVAQALRANGHELYYWESDGIAEVDFVIQTDTGVVPIEVTAGEHTRSRSLNRFITSYSPVSALRISRKNFGQDGSITSIPLYAVHLLKKVNNSSY